MAYVINPESQITDWVTDTTSPIPGGYLVNTRTVTDTVPYKGGAWTTDTPGSPWKKVDERKVIDQEGVPAHWVYKTENGTTTDKSKADWFDKEYSGWTTFDTKTEVTQEYIAPFTEYKTKNGVSTSESKADWFDKGNYSGWTEFDSREVEDKPYIAPFTEYKTDGGVTTDESKADWFKQASFEGWNQYGASKEVVTQEPTPDVVYYLVYKDGEFSKTTDESQASWIDVKVKVKDFWKKFDERKVIDREYVPGYTEYYVPSGEPTRELGESNWTTDEPEGWTFVDKRFFETKAAIPPKTVYDTVVVKKAWIEYIKIPASYTECNDRGVGAKTGGNDGPGATITQADYTGAWVGGGIAAGALTGWAAVAWAKRRKASQV